MVMLERIISGGQTGADRAALDVAIWHGFPHGGWCPKGRKALDGPLDSRYKLQETPSADYLQRNEWNVRDSDGTVVFTFDPKLTGGSKKTIAFAEQLKKPFLHIHRGNYQLEVSIQNFITQHNIRCLNVAGSRESKEPGIYQWTKEVLDRALFWSNSHPGMLRGPGEG